PPVDPEQRRDEVEALPAQLAARRRQEILRGENPLRPDQTPQLRPERQERDQIDDAERAQEHPAGELVARLAVRRADEPAGELVGAADGKSSYELKIGRAHV